MFNSTLGVPSAGDASLTMASRSKFYEEATWELLKARTILCSSYVYGYFHLEEHKTSKSWFELMQHELEDMTEKLSEMLQRPHLVRTPKRVLLQASQNCLQKRSDFLKAVYNGLQFEDPWMQNRNTTLAAVNCGGVVVGPTSTATLNRHHHRKKREDRQIWTKTLSYPNK